MSDNNFTDAFNDPNLPVDYASQHIDDDQPEEPRESIDSEEDQDGGRPDNWVDAHPELYPELPRTHEEVLQNLQKNGVAQNFLEREAHKYGIDYDERQKGEPEEIINNKN